MIDIFHPNDMSVEEIQMEVATLDNCFRTSCSYGWNIIIHNFGAIAFDISSSA